MRIAVQGQATISGDYYPSGNSNAILATMAASLLTDQPCVIHQIPVSARTSQMLGLAEHLGTQIHLENNRLSLQTPHVQTRTLPPEITRTLPASILFLAPIIARRRHARFEWDAPLARLRTHLTALQDLGQTIEIEGDAFNIIGQTWETQSIILTESSVTATALVCMLSAVLGRKTTIYNAASEPHLRILQHQLVKMGAKIEGIGSNLLTIYGMEETPGGVELTLPADHIEIASIAAIAAVTPGQIAIHHVYLPDLQMILKIYERLGVQYFLQADPTRDNTHILHVPEQSGMRVTRRFEDSDLEVDTSPWPGFPSDLVAMATVLATQTTGTTLIHEKLYNNRLLFTDKLKGMGANILLCDPHRAIVIGKNQLRGEYIDSPDVRTGLGMLAAALCANGQSVIDNAEVFNYVFADVISKLTALNAPIKVVG